MAISPDIFIYISDCSSVSCVFVIFILLVYTTDSSVFKDVKDVSTLFTLILAYLDKCAVTVTSCDKLQRLRPTTEPSLKPNLAVTTKEFVIAYSRLQMIKLIMLSLVMTPCSLTN